MILACLLLLAAQQEPEVRIFGQGFSAESAAKSWGPAFSSGYLKRNNLEVTTQEIEAIRAKFQPNVRQGRAADMFIKMIADSFKAQQALYRKHGGRVALSAFGAHLATDATVAEMRSLEKTGEVEFGSFAVREAFYKKILDSRGDGLTQGKNADEAFAHAPWDPETKP
jgi:hypothetical protein